MSSLPAGWYKDPADTSTQRYWDGEGWLGKAIPADAVPPDGPPPTEEPPPPPVASPPATAMPPAAPAAPPWGTPPPHQGWGAPPQQQSWGAPPQAGQAPPPGWVPPAGWTPPPGWVPPAGWTPPPGWVPQQGMPFPIPYPVQARPHGFALAGLGPRLMARILDILAVLALNVVVNGWFAYQFAQEFAPIWRAAMADPFGEQPEPTGRMEALLWTMLIVATLLWLLYEAPATASRGQTLGKRIMHIKVVAVESTAPLGFGRAFRRWARLGLWTPLWGCAGLGFLMQFIDSLSPVFDQRLGQALHDKTARTVVIEVPPGGRQTVDATPGGGSSQGEGPPSHP